MGGRTADWAGSKPLHLTMVGGGRNRLVSFKMLFGHCNLLMLAIIIKGGLLLYNEMTIWSKSNILFFHAAIVTN